VSILVIAANVLVATVRPIFQIEYTTAVIAITEN
jgi:hypothetical protein